MVNLLTKLFVLVFKNFKIYPSQKGFAFNRLLGLTKAILRKKGSQRLKITVNLKKD